MTNTKFVLNVSIVNFEQIQYTDLFYVANFV